MIILAIILLTISFFIQGISSTIIGYTTQSISMFYTIYILITFLILYPHFENQKKFLLLLAIFGLLTDLIYANTFIFNTCLFYVIYKSNKIFHFLFPYNLFTVNISNLLGIYLYHTITFLFLVLLNFDNYSIVTLLNILLNSTLMTIIYTTIIYWIVNIIKQRFELKEVK